MIHFPIYGGYINGPCAMYFFVDSCSHPPCHIQKMTIYITPSILQLLYFFGLSFCNSPQAWKGWFSISHKAENLTVICSHCIDSVYVTVLSVANFKLKLFWSKMIGALRYRGINRTISWKFNIISVSQIQSFLFSSRGPMTSHHILL